MKALENRIGRKTNNFSIKFENLKIRKIENIRKLEKSEKIILAKLKNELRLNHDKISQTELTDEAYRQTKYKEWLIAYTQAEKDFTLAKDYYNNLIALKDMRITEESSARYLINKK